MRIVVSIKSLALRPKAFGAHARADTPEDQ